MLCAASGCSWSPAGGDFATQIAMSAVDCHQRWAAVVGTHLHTAKWTKEEEGELLRVLKQVWSSSHPIPPHPHLFSNRPAQDYRGPLIG